MATIIFFVFTALIVALAAWALIRFGASESALKELESMIQDNGANDAKVAKSDDAVRSGNTRDRLRQQARD